VAELEQAAFLNDLPGESPTGFSRLYYGAEFCFWRLPSIEKTLASRAWARRIGWAYTLVTPVLGEAERRQLDSFFKAVLPELTAGDEILISDWGALELVRSVRDDLTVILGRTLSGQKRGPRILDSVVQEGAQLREVGKAPSADGAFPGWTGWTCRILSASSAAVWPPIPCLRTSRSLYRLPLLE